MITWTLGAWLGSHNFCKLWEVMWRWQISALSPDCAELFAVSIWHGVGEVCSLQKWRHIRRQIVAAHVLDRLTFICHFLRFLFRPGDDVDRFELVADLERQPNILHSMNVFIVVHASRRSCDASPPETWPCSLVTDWNPLYDDPASLLKF